MASGHLCPERTEVTINQFVKIDCNGDDPGTRAARFLAEGRRYSSIARYKVRLGLYLHKYVKSLDKVIRLP